MVSRKGLHFRGGRTSGEDDRLEKVRAETAKRVTEMSSAPATSRIPMFHSSIFSKGNRSRTDAGAPGSKTVDSPTLRKPQRMPAGGPPSKQKAPAIDIPATSRNFGLGIQAAQNPRGVTSPQTKDGRREGRPRNVLRRKASFLDQHDEHTSTGSNSFSDISTSLRSPREVASSPGGYTDPFPGSMLGMSMPAVSASSSLAQGNRPLISEEATSTSCMANYLSRGQTQKLSSTSLPRPASGFPAHSSSPSTRYSESPGPFSRTSTPTSMSSHSPGIVLAPSKCASRPRQLSPTRSRPPITRRRLGGTAHQDSVDGARTQGLPALRESLTSSSSSSTFKGVDRVEVTEAQKANVRSRLSPPPPSPPLRRPSKQYTKPRIEGGSRGSRDGAPNTTGLCHLDLSRASIDSEQHTNTSFPVSTQRRTPQRPSRDGTPTLDDNGPSPVIQSNLSRLNTTGHKRRQSIEKATPTVAVGKGIIYPEFASLIRSPNSASTSSTRRPSGSLSPTLNEMAQRPSQDSQNPGQRAITPLQTNTASESGKREPSPLSASSSMSPSRFGIFSRHKKLQPKSPDMQTGECISKKGPAAGTGHEGYGKYARRGRSGTATTSASRTRSTSANNNPASAARTSFSHKSVSSRGDFEIDDFYLKRLAPVIIPGGAAVVEDRSGTSEPYVASSGESSASITSSVYTETESKAAAIRGNSSGKVSTNLTYNSSSERRVSRSLPQERDISAKMEPARYLPGMNNTNKIPTLATRRSLHRSQTFKEAEPFKVPPSINTGANAPSPSLRSRDTMQSLVPRTDSSIDLTDDISEGREGNWLKPRKTEKKITSPGRWNFYQRAHAPPNVVGRSNFYDDVNSVQEVAVTISRLPEARPIAHYAMIDEKDHSDLRQDAEDGGNPLEEEDMWYRNNSAEHAKNQEHKMSVLLPSPPVFSGGFTNQSRPASPAVPLHRAEALGVRPTVLKPLSEPEQPRLRQVGRIPRVISKRDRLHEPPPPSSSRPFARTPVSERNPPTSDTGNQFPIVERPVLGVQTDFIPSHPFDSPEFRKPASAPVATAEVFSPADTREFLAFPPRVGSEVSVSSSSGILSFAATTAILPETNATLSEDEVWNEYDELLDNVGSPSSSKVPRTTANASRLHLSREGSGRRLGNATRGDEKKGLPAIGKQESRQDPLHPISLLTPTPKGASASPPRSSRLLSPIQSPELPPSTPLSFSEFIAGYGNRSSAGAKDQLQSDVSASRYSTESIHSTPSPGRDGHNPNTQLMAQRTSSGCGAQGSLRFRALMVSRWLSFGRVLFSPAHTEIQHSRPNRVLVLDGLGNPDWSFYCALTYPSAIVYNLSAFQPAPTNTDDSSSRPSSPMPNHRQIHHSNIAHPFPFPRGFFTAAVFRFPIASSDAAYRNAISECKRVLRPGGYLEMSVLDIDMVNMGNRARRAACALKLRMQAQGPDVSLQPASDSIQKLLGRRGFENLNRCMVGVPVAGLVSSSRAGSFDEGSRSWDDMLKDPTRKGDEGITKMVAEVGRWWYTRCYEKGVLEREEEAREGGREGKGRGSGVFGRIARC
ncbi:MAG: hypothetical protein FRX48_00895 [Lasallia pustulata]|uniref:Methyltransferase type 11 domain-containing protein n=1 Tax=Lasallia pustulata TaxID=136370 RepID=A0A5M8Q4N9_9LECA|nr:MAG: hypothetical protein FRX48_00895 [Lasallia pustulata]